MAESIIVARPEHPHRLVLLFHGVGATAAGLVPLGQAVVRALPSALVVSVAAPFASDLGQGAQWFSVRGISEANRIERVAQAMPLFVDSVHRWQREASLGAAETTLLGFSQGAIMALESTQQPEKLSSRVVAIAGRFAALPRVPPTTTIVRLLHGEADSVMPIESSEQAVDALKRLGVEASLDRFPDLGHAIDARVVARVLERLSD